GWSLVTFAFVEKLPLYILNKCSITITTIVPSVLQVLLGDTQSSDQSTMSMSEQTTKFGELKCIVVGGECLPIQQIKQCNQQIAPICEKHTTRTKEQRIALTQSIKHHNIVLFNCYGPTETTIDTTKLEATNRITKTGILLNHLKSTPIGRPHKNI